MTNRGPEGARSARQDYEYERQGTAALFLAIEPLGGRRQVRVRTRRTAHDFAEVLRALVDEDYPEAEKIVLVVDNLNTHHPGALYERFTPDEARRIAEKETLVTQVAAWERQRNQHASTVHRQLAIHDHRCTDQTAKTISVISCLTRH